MGKDKLTCFIRITGVLVLVFFSLFSCSTSVHRKSAHSQAIEEYRQALHAYRQNDMVQAEIGFRQSLSYEPGFAPALEGLARIAFQNKQLNKTERLLDQALRADHRWVPAYLLKAQLYHKRQAYALAIDELLRARQQDVLVSGSKLDSLILLRLARNYAALGNYIKAYTFIDRLVMSKSQSEAVYKEWLELGRKRDQQLIEGSRVSRLQTKQVITRGELAILMAAILPVGQKQTIRYRGKIYDLPIDSVKAGAVMHCTARGWLPVFPDSTVQVSDRLDRIELALIADRIWNQELGPVEPMQVKIADVADYLPYSNALKRMTGVGLFSLDEEGRIYPRQLVSGKEAASLLRRLSEKLKSPVFPSNSLRNQHPQAE